jgi:mono/diheme cytochrome c family protein
MQRSPLTLLAVLALSPALQAQPVGFNKDIRPILADACFHCHGPDPGTRKAGLRLDTEAGFFTAKKGEEPTIIKGQPDKSSLFQRLLSSDEDEVMPPPDSHKEIKPAQIALIKEWISQGAPWQPHWSLIPPQKPAAPVVKDEAWIKTPIDRFVLASLEKAGLTPAPEADARTLVRRISLDVTGLPPSPELLARYCPTGQTRLTDTQINSLIDELMKSPAYGEHRARYWLDAARYGDTHGMHFDNYREMWPYRDWVVKAFNRNEPFDQFTVEQIAGDLLPNRTDDQLIATGFQRCNITTNEGGTIDEENLANYAVDRVQTMGWVYFGLTTNCSQCHDHKFDPITQHDFYSLAAFFRNTTQGAKDGNVKDGKGPVLVIPSDQDKPRWDKLPAEIAEATKLRDERRKAAGGDFNQWLASAKPEHLDQDVPTQGLQVHLPLNEGVGNEIANVCGTAFKVTATGQVSWTPGGKLGPAPVIKPGSTFEVSDAGDFELNQKFSYGAWVKAGRNGVFGAIMARMDEKNGYRGWDLWQNDRGLSVHIIDKWTENAMKVSTRDAALKPGEWQHVFVTYNGSGKAAGIKIYVNGVEQKRLIVNTNTIKPKASIRTKVPLKIGQRSEGQYFTDGSIQDARVYDRMLSESEIKTLADVGPLRAILAAASDKRTPQQRNALFAHYLATRDAEWQQHDSQMKKLEAEKEAIKGRSPITHVQEEVMNVAPMANILMRGAYDKVGERVDAAVPASLGKLPAKAPKNRLGLAQWVVSKDNPLTARVTVNRFWQEVFGQGIVKTPEDFGIMGAAPSHPELLDWLAVEFRDGGEFSHHLRETKAGSPWRQITRHEDGIKEIDFSHDGAALYLRSVKDSPRGKLLRMTTTGELSAAKVIVPESDAVIEGFLLTAKHLFIADMIGGPSRIRQLDLDGSRESTVPMPIASGIGGLLVMDERLLFRQTSFVAPAAWMLYDPAKTSMEKTALINTSPVDFSDIEAVREFAISKDGTKVPINILRRKGTPLDGSNPDSALCLRWLRPSA